MYNHASERINVSNTEMNRAAGRLYEAFLSTWKEAMDLRDPESILAAHAAAQEMGLFDTAKEVRQYYFGQQILTYGVVYISDACSENCGFCPAGQWNRNFQAKTLKVPEIVAEVLCTLLQGHKRVCILSANWPETKFMAYLEQWLPEVIRVGAPLGLVEIILNVQTLSAASYQHIHQLKEEVNPEFHIQVRTFQESYLKEHFCQAIKKARGNKHNFEERRAGQATAWQAGIDSVGLGVLFGLSPLPLLELSELVKHAGELLATGTKAVRICLPSAHEVKGLNTKIPFDLPVEHPAYAPFSELVYALARLALPEMCWVMSERDPAWLRQRLVEFASETTVGVRPGVGDNLAAYQATKKELHFLQATTYSDDPGEYIAQMTEKGYQVDLDLSPERKEKIQESLSKLGY